MNIIYKSFFNVYLVCVFILFPLHLLAETPEEKGLRIAEEAHDYDEGFGDSEASMKMILRNAHGEESSRVFRSKTLEVENDGDKTLFVFDSPRDVKGTATLTFTHKMDPDDQWLYLPALKRVKRITSDNRSGSFVGSEFAYEDLGSQEVEIYTRKFLREEDCPGFSESVCHVFERYPVEKSSGYTRQVVWMDKEHYRVWKIDYFDRKNELLKTLIFENYKLFVNRHWRAMGLKMTNHQTKKSTDIEINEMSLQVGLTSRDFDQKSLSRVR